LHPIPHRRYYCNKWSSTPGWTGGLCSREKGKGEKETTTRKKALNWRPYDEEIARWTKEPTQGFQKDTLALEEHISKLKELAPSEDGITPHFLAAQHIELLETALMLAKRIEEENSLIPLHPDP
jgi:hypothetical protein